MYIPRWFKEERPSVLQDAIDHNAFGTLVTTGRNGLLASHIPMILNRDQTTNGAIQGHIARANMQWRDSINEIEGLAMFMGPDAYISPSWYQTKEETGKVVPTWNYLAVHARGKVDFIQDPDWLRTLVTKLTSKFEGSNNGTWKVSDAPPDYIDQELKAIVGFEMPIRQIEGKWKMGQNRAESDRNGAIKGLRRRGSGHDYAVASEMEILDRQLKNRTSNNA